MDSFSNKVQVSTKAVKPTTGVAFLSHGARTAYLRLSFAFSASTCDYASAPTHSIRRPLTSTGSRLYPDMLRFVSQVRIATGTAKGAAARLSGSSVEMGGQRVDVRGYSRTYPEGAGVPRDVQGRDSSKARRFLLPNFYFT